MTHEICVQNLCLWSLNSNYSLVPEIQFKYICAAVNFTCPFEAVRKLNPRIETAILNFIAYCGYVGEKMLIKQ